MIYHFWANMGSILMTLVWIIAFAISGLMTVAITATLMVASRAPARNTSPLVMMLILGVGILYFTVTHHPF